MTPRTFAAERTAPALVITACPECGAPAEIEWRDTVESTEGPVEHCKVRCVAKHWFLIPTDRLVSAPAVSNALSAGS